MWERAELARLFATPIWTGCASAGRRTAPGDLILRDEKFWLPLIAVFSGLRQEEICQLQVEDIRQDEDVWFFEINDRPPRKVKNATAVRRVPVHAELLRLGFRTHVEAQRRRRQTRVFPNLAPGGADGRLGHAFTKWFTRYRRDVALYRSGLFYHTSEHDRGEPMRSVSTVVSLPEATNDTLTLIPAALHGVARTWREQGAPPWRYSKAGIVTTDLVPLAGSQRALIGQLDCERSASLMGALDACNARWGRGAVVPARAGLERQRRGWTTKFEMRTPRYTTRVEELPVARA